MIPTDVPLLVVAGGATGAILLFWAFVQLEYRGRRETVFGIVLAVFFVELLLYQGEHQVPNGLARIPLGTGGLRPMEILLPLAVGARWVASPTSRRISGTACAWAAFLLWYTTAAVMGILASNPTSEVLAQGKSIVTIGGGIALVSGLRPERLVQARIMGRWALAIGVTSLVWFVLTLTDRAFAVGLPMLEVRALGALSVDARLVLPVFGVIVLLVEACRRDRRVWAAGAGLAMLPAPLVGTQRAAYVGLGFLLAGVMMAAVGRTWSRRLAVTASEVLLLLLFISGSLIAATLVREEPPVDLSAQFEQSFTTEGDARTTRARLRLWGDAIELIGENPVMGAGLGIRQPLRQEWDPTQVVETTPHNLALEVAMRSGLTGLALLVIALVATFVEGVRTWRRHSDQLVAALSLGALVGIAAFVANASVQTSLDRFRNTTMLGMLVGVVLCCARSRWEHDEQPFSEPEVDLREPSLRRWA